MDLLQKRLALTNNILSESKRAANKGVLFSEDSIESQTVLPYSWVYSLPQFKSDFLQAENSEETPRLWSYTGYIFFVSGVRTGGTNRILQIFAPNPLR